MEQYYDTLAPIQGMHIKEGRPQIMLLPAGTLLSVRCWPERWPELVEVDSQGALLILFRDDLLQRAQRLVMPARTKAAAC